MERLTKKISKTIQDKYSLGSYLQYDFANTDDTNKLLNKLGKFEDFMEANGFENLKHLDFTLEEQNKIIEAYEQENQALKDRWQKLEEYIYNEKEEVEVLIDPYAEEYELLCSVLRIIDRILLGMQELEKGGEKCQKK